MRLRESLWPEQVGDEVLILEPELGVVHRVSDAAATVALALMSGATVAHDAPGVDELRDAGLLDEDDDQVSELVLSRRRALALGSVVVGLGVVSVALPPAAAAASQVPASQPSATALGGDALVGVTATGG